MKKISLLSIVVILSACSARMSTTSSPTSRKLSISDVERGAQRFPGYTLVELEEGKRLNDNHCGKCHGLYAPASQTEAAWREIVPRMAKKARIDEQARDLVLKYLVTMSGS